MDSNFQTQRKKWIAQIKEILSKYPNLSEREQLRNAELQEQEVFEEAQNSREDFKRVYNKLLLAKMKTLKDQQKSYIENYQTRSQPDESLDTSLSQSDFTSSYQPMDYQMKSYGEPSRGSSMQGSNLTNINYIKQQQQYQHQQPQTQTQPQSQPQYMNAKPSHVVTRSQNQPQMDPHMMHQSQTQLPGQPQNYNQYNPRGGMDTARTQLGAQNQMHGQKGPMMSNQGSLGRPQQDNMHFPQQNLPQGRPTSQYQTNDGYQHQHQHQQQPPPLLQQSVLSEKATSLVAFIKKYEQVASKLLNMYKENFAQTKKPDIMALITLLEGCLKNDPQLIMKLKNYEAGLEFVKKQIEMNIVKNAANMITTHPEYQNYKKLVSADKRDPNSAKISALLECCETKSYDKLIDYISDLEQIMTRLKQEEQKAQASTMGDPNFLQGPSQHPQQIAPNSMIGAGPQGYQTHVQHPQQQGPTKMMPGRGVTPQKIVPDMGTMSSQIQQKPILPPTSMQADRSIPSKGYTPGPGPTQQLQNTRVMQESPIKEIPLAQRPTQQMPIERGNIPPQTLRQPHLTQGGPTNIPPIDNKGTHLPTQRLPQTTMPQTMSGILPELEQAPYVQKKVTRQTANGVAAPHQLPQQVQQIASKIPNAGDGMFLSQQKDVQTLQQKLQNVEKTAQRTQAKMEETKQSYNPADLSSQRMFRNIQEFLRDPYNPETPSTKAILGSNLTLKEESTSSTYGDEPYKKHQPSPANPEDQKNAIRQVLAAFHERNQKEVQKLKAKGYALKEYRDSKDSSEYEFFREKRPDWTITMIIPYATHLPIQIKNSADASDVKLQEHLKARRICDAVLQYFAF